MGSGMIRQDRAIRFTYTNWRGEVAVRHAVPIRLAWVITDWHPEPQWIMFAHDLDKGQPRTFALRDCDFTQTGEDRG